MTDNFKHKASKNSGFTVPKGYFDSFDEELDAKIRAHSFPKSPGFNTPEGYFKNFKISEIKGFIAQKLQRMLQKNHTRIDFAQKLQEIVLFQSMIQQII